MEKSLDFVKMHGAGNDYIYMDWRRQLPENLPELARRVSHRHFGIGADGLVAILPSDKADFRMRMFNADGSEAQMCGNASRCIAKYLHDHNLTDKTDISLETLAGIKILHLHLNKDGREVESVTVDMGYPILKPHDIPVDICPEKGKDCGVKAPVVTMPLDDTLSYMAVAVGMGNPHGVIFADEITDEMVLRHGPKLETHPVWPEKANIEFVKVISPTEVEARVWERGSGETMACGTGACAITVAGVLRGLLERRVALHLPGGTLIVEWNEKDNHLYLTGNAATVAEGKFYDTAGL